MADWMITWKYRHDETTPHSCVDTAIHNDLVKDVTKEIALKIFPKLCRHSEWVEILSITSSKVWDRQIKKARGELE